MTYPKIIHYDFCPGWFGSQVLYVTVRELDWSGVKDINFHEPVEVVRKRKATTEEAAQFLVNFRKRGGYKVVGTDPVSGSKKLRLR